jgi:hypothetical protein
MVSTPAIGQCLYFSQFGSATAGAVGVPVTISTCSFAGEFSPVFGITAGNSYTFTSQSGYVTVREGTSGGPVVGFGPSPLTVIAPSSSDLFGHWSLDAACTQSFTCYVTSVTNNGASSACSGTPAPGNTLGPVSACPSAPFTLSLQTTPTGSGLAFQWESSPDGLSWTPIVGATGATYQASQTAATYYQCQVTCTGNPTATSTPVLVGMNSFLNCYCISQANNPFDEEIYSVTVNGSTNAYACGAVAPGPGSILNRYSNFMTLPPLTTVQQGQNVAFQVEENECDGAPFYPFGTGIWIDWNQNGLFTDAGEAVFIEGSTAVGPRNVPGNFTVPIDAVPGTTAMRVIVAEGISGPGLTPCLQYGWGETEDYLITVAVPSPCTNPPTAGTATASGTAVCSGTTVFFNVSGTSLGSGQTYQWEYSTDGIAFGPITGATNPNYSEVITAAGFYRLAVTCGTTTFTNAVNVTLNSFIDCYCTSSAQFTFIMQLSNVSFGALNNTSVCNELAPGPGSAAGLYSNYRTLTPVVNVTQLDVVPISLSTANCFSSGFTMGSKVFIDWNQNGLLTDPGEEVYDSGSNTNAFTASGSVLVPLSAVPGNTLMRVVLGWNYPSIFPCGPTTYGETEDYLINVLPTVPCTDPATPGTTVASAATVCPGTTVNLSLSGNSSGSSQTYLWQSSPDDVIYTDITGATNSFYTATVNAPTYYRARVTCGLGSNTPTFSVPVLVGLNSFINCYCSSAATQSFDEEIFNVTVGTLNNSSTCATLAPGPGSVQNLYSNYTVGLPVPNLPQTDVVSFSLQAGTCNGNYGNQFAIFIDWNQNGLFTDAGENVALTPLVQGPHTATGSFTVPGTATLGNTRMRVINVENPFLSITPCGTYNWGETEDYLVNITIPPPCATPAATLGTVLASSAVVNWNCPSCTGSYYVEYGAPGFTPGTGSTIGGGAGLLGPIPNGTNTATITGLVGGTGYAAFVRQDCSNNSNGFSGNAGPLTFTTPPGCGSTFFDNGGAFGNYTANANVVNTICPDIPGEIVTVSFSAFNTESGWDPLYIFDGPTTASPKVASANGAPFGNNVYGTGGYWGNAIPGPFTATNVSGCLTVAFTSDGSVQFSGYAATVACNAPPPCPIPTLVNATGVATTTATINWTCNACTGTFVVEYGPVGFTPGTGATAGVNGTVVTAAASPALLTGLASGTAYNVYVRQNCDGLGTAFSPNNFTPVLITTGPGCGNTFTDNGGPFAPYTANADVTTTICATNPGDQVLMLFTSFDTEASWDPLYVFNGASTAAPLIASANGTSVGGFPAGGWWGTTAPTSTGSPGLVQSTNPSGCLTYRFRSDGSVQNAGWVASISCVTPNFTCSAASAIACGETKQGFTNGGPNSLPTTACGFNGAPSTGGVGWWSYTATADNDVVMSTCGQANFNTRISVFKPMPDCSTLECVGGADDLAGCPSNSSEITFKALQGETYYIAVHGDANSEGLYSLSAFCVPVCNPANGNDRCANATPLTASLTGSGVFTSDDNGCAYVDGPTQCSGPLPVQGVWYSFNSGANAQHTLTLASSSQNPSYTATAISYALYDGACTSSGAAGELVCANGGGASVLSLTPNTDYRLLVYNQGGVGTEGTFGVMLERPAVNDASVDQVLFPSGLLCDTKFDPVVRLKNNGEGVLTSVKIRVTLDNVLQYVYDWSGALLFGATEDVLLPEVQTTTGLHTLDIATLQPNAVLDEISSNDGSSSQFDASGQTVKVRITSDNDGSGTTWTIFDPFFFPVASGGPFPNNTTVVETVCLSTALGNSWSFFLFDSFGDGICCNNGNGSWALLDGSDKVILRDQGTFTTQSPSSAPQTPAYASGHEFTLPLGAVQPATGECAVFDNLLQNKVFITPVAGVTNYQYEFSNPDAGFRRRVLLNRTHVLFSDMQSNPLSLGVTYFLRARADQGAPGVSDDNWGSGCEMAWSASAAFCTQLITTPGPTFSCGVTRTFGGSDKIWAQPVPGVVAAPAPGQPNPYQFRFTGTGSNSGYVRNIFRSSYICPLSWVTNPLVNGQTYDVQVQVWVAGAWKGFCGNTCQVTINNNPAQGGRSIAEETASDNVQLWPNPVRDGRVNLRIDGLADAEQNITVDVFDVFGKRVFTQEYGNSGELFNTVLVLNSDIATGLYMVNITVNDRTYTKRVSVL